jgi:hypothetical protein
MAAVSAATKPNINISVAIPVGNSASNLSRVASVEAANQEVKSTRTLKNCFFFKLPSLAHAC